MDLKGEAGSLVLTSAELERVLDYLRANPGNLAGAARVIGKTREWLLAFKELHYEPFERIEEEYLDELECSVRLAAAGRPVSDDFDRGYALRVLQICRAVYWASNAAAREKARKEADEKIKSRPRRAGYSLSYRDSETWAQMLSHLGMGVSKDEDESDAGGVGGSVDDPTLQ